MATMSMNRDVIFTNQVLTRSSGRWSRDGAYEAMQPARAASEAASISVWHIYGLIGIELGMSSIAAASAAPAAALEPPEPHFRRRHRLHGIS